MTPIARFPLRYKRHALAAALAGALALASPASQAAAFTFSVNDSTVTTGSVGLATSFLDSSISTGTQTYNYAVAYFVPDYSAVYVIGQSLAPVDTVMVLYTGVFDPANPGSGLLVNNDDTSTGQHQTILGSGAPVSCGSNPNFCPQVTATLTAGQIYSILISTFSPGDSLGTPLNLEFYTNNDGEFYAASPVAPAASSVLSSASALNNGPAINGARVIDATPELRALFAGLNSDQQRSAAASQTLPLLAGGTSSATSNTLTVINRLVQSRQAVTSGQASGDAALKDQHFWLKPFGSWADQNSRNGVAGYSATTQGLALGADTAVSDNARLGVAFAYAQTNLDGDAAFATQDAQIDTFQLIGYGSYTLAPDTELSVQLDGGKNQNDGTRHINFAGTTAKSDYNSYSAHAGVGLSHTLRFNERLSVQPSVRADYTWIGEQGYHEKGADVLNLDVDSRDVEELIFSLDGTVNYNLTANTVLSATLGAGYDAINETASITSTYAGASAAAFTTRGLDPSPWLGRGGLGLSHTLANGTEVSLRYDAESRSDFLNQSASLKARWAF